MYSNDSFAHCKREREGERERKARHFPVFIIDKFVRSIMPLLILKRARIDLTMEKASGIHGGSALTNDFDRRVAKS